MNQQLGTILILAQHEEHLDTQSDTFISYLILMIINVTTYTLCYFI